MINNKSNIHKIKNNKNNKNKNKMADKLAKKTIPIPSKIDNEI